MKKKIVIVDDDTAVVDSTKRILESHRYKVGVATNGKQAMDMVMAEKPDLVILDILLPDIQGYDVCRFFRKQKDLLGLKILIVSGCPIPLKETWAQKAGADGYLDKPYEAIQLLARVSKLIG